MSYDVTFLDPEGLELGWRNYTGNVSGMWAKALELPDKQAVDANGVPRTCTQLIDGEWIPNQPHYNRGLRLLHGAPASEAAGILSDAALRMQTRPDEYEPMEPVNGWGSYSGAMAMLTWMADMASAHPDSHIHISS